MSILDRVLADQKRSNSQPPQQNAPYRDDDDYRPQAELQTAAAGSRDDRRGGGHVALNAAKYGGDQAIAAPRGEGKTSIVQCVTISHGVGTLTALPYRGFRVRPSPSAI
ncbi:MAG: hypothetical protein MUE50_24040 [Pirellulaceae bacterium]|jgi:hypothetical protein|nr:hypothetical protein [Pirellulaceae bacterium]